jgi:hypothetical protein
MKAPIIMPVVDWWAWPAAVARKPATKIIGVIYWYNTAPSIKRSSYFSVLVDDGQCLTRS